MRWPRFFFDHVSDLDHGIGVESLETHHGPSDPLDELNSP